MWRQCIGPDEQFYFFCVLQYAFCVSHSCIVIGASVQTPGTELDCCIPFGRRPNSFLFWLQRGHTLTPQDLQEVADLVSDNDSDSAYVVDMLTSR